MFEILFLLLIVSCGTFNLETFVTFSSDVFDIVH